MKKIILMVFIAITHHAIAQESESFIKDIKVGGIFGVTASTTSLSSDKPFTLGQNLFAVTTLKTAKTFHSVMYGFGNNSVNLLNGYFLKNNWDTYVVYSKNLHSGNYLGYGIEKMESIDRVKFFLISEMGTSFTGRASLSFGLLINTSWSLKKQ
jgi:hypothetical protein